ncbi:MAG TPA: DUF262 domain-containing HNH endonuclease family protein [Flavobacteriales bacterium]|nr:DUF262 domain-containing HNH endonuclease family protein [Flavobacteriales bacterium]
MNANAVSLIGIFEKKMQLEVPLFQRQYVWSQEKHWEPLWEDISRKFEDYVEGRRDTPVHFLGAMVFDQKQTPTTHVERRQAIDGQQRLTTLQIFLAAFRDFAKEQGCEELAKECEAYTVNKGMMANPDVDMHKVWPTQLDRKQFADVMRSGSRDELDKRHPLVRRKYQRKPDPRPRMVEAYIYFDDRLYDFFIGHEDEPPLQADSPIASRMEECFQAMKSALQVVVIDLDKEDDAQVIFETLNARGEPLLPADLLRNFIFLRAARKGEPMEQLYDQHWRKFDEDFWREEVSQGRQFRPRSDLFLQHFLASKRGTDVPIKHLFTEYKWWIEKKQPYGSVAEELMALDRQGDDFRRIIAPHAEDKLYELFRFLEAFEVRTVYPLLLHLMQSEAGRELMPQVASILESYILRRAFCGYTTKNYNRIFLTLVRQLDGQAPTIEAVKAYFLGLSGESTVWPNDAVFKEEFIHGAVYERLNNPKLALVLERLNKTYLSKQSEDIEIKGASTVEHLLPQEWRKHWPLPDGQVGMTEFELADADDSDARATATRARESALHSLGNLTIITGSLNTSVSNGPWLAKRQAILRKSLLPINQQLHDAETWDEDSILRRGTELWKRAKSLWPM